jgi:integrase
MATTNVTIAVVLYKSKTLADGSHPVMIRLTKNGERKYISIKKKDGYMSDGCSSQLRHWSKISNSPRSTHPQYKILSALIPVLLTFYHDRKETLIKAGVDFTLNDLTQEYTPIDMPEVIKVYSFTDTKIKSLDKSGRVGNAKVYKDMLSVLKQFVNEEKKQACILSKTEFTEVADIEFSNIDHGFLTRMETYFMSRGNVENGMAVRFRTLRAVFNAAIVEKLISRELYPFDTFKVNERFSNKTQKRAITKDDILKIGLITTVNEKEIKPGSAMFEAQKYFIFSYYCQGINFVDMANLKWKDINNGRIFYKRSKTGGELNFKLLAPAIEIIEYWKPITKISLDEYIFPILNATKRDNKIAHDTPARKHDRIHKVLTRVNRDLKAIGKELNIDTSLTSYVARHTFATVLKRSGVATAIISESMGHQTEAVTKTYLKDFEDTIIDEAMVNLM